MKAPSLGRLGAGILASALLGTVAIAGTGSAASGEAGGGNDVAKIRIKTEDGRFDFFGPRRVERGQQLRIINRTDPMETGPHSFTLVRGRLIDEREERDACEAFKSKVCQQVLEAHQVGPSPDFPIGKFVVEKGKRGWDKQFTNRRKGDSWFTDEQGEKHTRTVKAEKGDTISYFCIVHPFMRGKFKVKD